MSEHQKLLDAARSAVDLLTTVLSQKATGEERDHRGAYGVVNEPSTDNFDKPPNKGVTSQSSVNRGLHSSNKFRDGTMTSPRQNGASLDDNSYNPAVQKGGKPSSTKSMARSMTDRADGTDYQSRVKELRSIVDRKLGQALAHRVPSQVAKVPPQRLIACESHDDVTADHSYPSTERRGVEEGEHYCDIAVERALASSVLVLENAKLREELAEVKTELASLRMEAAMKSQVSRQNAEVQTFATDLREFYFPDERKADEISSDEDTEYMTTYSNSSPDSRLLPRRNAGRSAKTFTDAYFCTPGSTLSTPGTLGRASTVSSSGGGLVRRKLELPKSLVKEAGYMSLNSYDESSEDSIESAGCCPFLCFKSSRKPSRV